jgi:hypothetical protein
MVRNFFLYATCAAALLEGISVYRPERSFYEEGTFDAATISKAHRRNNRAKSQKRKHK